MGEQYSLRQLFPELEEDLYTEMEQHGEIREMPAGSLLLKGRHINLTPQEIAADLNASREVISRLMKKMEKDGWIVMQGNAFEWIK